MTALEGRALEAETATVESRFRKSLDWATILAFLVVIVVPVAGRWVLADSGAEVEREFRRAAPPPELSLEPEALAAFPKRFEGWFQDHFALRTPLIATYNAMMVFGFEESPNPTVLQGKDYWMFKGEPYQVASFRGTELFPPAELEQWRSYLESRRDWLAARGIRYLFVIAPDKGTIYPEYLPDHLLRNDVTRTDELFRHMRERSDVEMLDLRPTLLVAKGEELLYYPLGTHWNVRGAYVAYRALLGRLQPWFPSLVPHERSLFHERPAGRTAEDDWAYKMHIGDFLSQENPRWAFRLGRPRRVPAANPHFHAYEAGPPDAPRLILIGDSMGERLEPFLAPHFARTVWCSFRFEYADPEGMPAWLRSERPDVVVEEVVERRLMEPPPPLPPWPEG